MPFRLIYPAALGKRVLAYFVPLDMNGFVGRVMSRNSGRGLLRQRRVTMNYVAKSDLSVVLILRQRDN